MLRSIGVFAGLVCLSLLSSCGGESGSGGEDGNINLVFKSSDLRRPVASHGSGCSVSVDGVGQGGTCFTPVSVSGNYVTGNLSATTGGAGVRIIGGGDEVHGLDSVFERHAFDLATYPSVRGEDNIQDGTLASYNLLSLDLVTLDTVYLATASNKYYHVRAFFVDQPPSAATVFAACGLDVGTLTQMDLVGQIFSGINARRGDLMMCIKNNASDTCADSDFQWVDNTGSLTSTRPTSPAPKMLTGSYLTGSDECSLSADHPSLTWGMARLTFGINNPVSVSAVIDKGVKTYTVINSGVTQSGTELTLTADVDLTDSLFAPSGSAISNLSTESESNLLTQIAELQLKPIYAIANKTTAAEDNSINADVTLSVQ